MERSIDAALYLLAIFTAAGLAGVGIALVTQALHSAGVV